MSLFIENIAFSWPWLPTSNPPSVQTVFVPIEITKVFFHNSSLFVEHSQQSFSWYFCTAAYEAFCLVTENILRFAVCESVSDIFEFIGAGNFFILVFISGVTTVVGYFVIISSYTDEDISSEWVPVSVFY